MSESFPLESLLTTRQASEILNVCQRTVESLVASGDLPSIKIGASRRIDPAELREWIVSKRKGGHPHE